MVNFDAQKSEFEPRKKSLSPNPYENPLFAKNGVQIGQILPLWAHLYFTPGYRGLPPCTLSQHPDNRETGYSNVLLPELTKQGILRCVNSAFHNYDHIHDDGDDDHHQLITACRRGIVLVILTMRDL